MGEMAQEVSRVAFSTTDIDEAHSVLTRLYASHGVRFHRRPQAFEFHQQATSAGAMMVGHLRYRVDVDLLVEPLDKLLFVAVAGGRIRTRAGRDELLANRGDVLLNRVGVPLSNTCRHADVYTLTVDRPTIAATAAANFGIDPADFRFESIAPVSAAMAQHWRDTMIYAYRLFSGPAEVLRNPLVVQAVTEMTAAAALAAFPNTATTVPYQRGPGPVAPAAVRRAVAFIEENPAAPITTQQVAAAAQVSPRALQDAFRRHLGTTPMAHARRVRLERAHRDLQAADPSRGDTVQTIARRWGWASLSRFAADYRAVYGRPPSRTLRT
jgi:AraC-like DNA-binding protein